MIANILDVLTFPVTVVGSVDLPPERVDEIEAAPPYEEVLVIQQPGRPRGRSHAWVVVRVFREADRVEVYAIDISQHCSGDRPADELDIEGLEWVEVWMSGHPDCPDPPGPGLD